MKTVIQLNLGEINQQSTIKDLLNSSRPNTNRRGFHPRATNPTNQMKIFKSDSDTGKTKSISVKQALRDLGETLYDVLLESKCVSCGTTFWHIK